MSKKIVVVVGATGNQGGSIIQSLLNDPVTKEAFQIRGITRDPSKPNAQKLKEQGVELVRGDLDNKEELHQALKGAYAAFVVTNYWEYIDGAKEEKQGKTFADVAKEEGVQHLIFSSLPDVNKETNGALQNVYHFDAKNRVEQYIRGQGIPATFFYPGFYMPNIPSAIQKTDNGLGYFLPCPESSKIPLFDPADTGKWVKAIWKKGLTEQGRKEILGQRVLAATDYYTPVDIMNTVAKVTGQKAFFKQCTEDQFRDVLRKTNLPEFAVTELYENMVLLGPQYGYYNNASLQPSLDLMEEKPTTWEAYFEQNGKANFQ